MRERDKYLKIVEWSEEDRCYVGSVPGWIGKCCHGDEWIEIYKKEGHRLPNPTKWDYAMTIISIYSITEQKIHDL